MANRQIPPPIPLYRVLIDEYESQRVGPPLPERFVERFELAERPAQEEKHPPPDPGDREGAERRERCIRKELDDGLVAAFYRFLHDHGVRRSALCVSGGGIRSATFGLGLVQGLAQKGLLSRFDYLSTVSGGGYLGSWLSAWIRRHGLAEVERQLASPPASPLAPEPEPIRHLRSYSRYMSPKLGLLSADTWTLVGIFLRNLLLNWLVFLPLIAAALMFPRLSTAVLRSVAFADQADLNRGVLAATVLLGILVVAYSTASRPSLANVDPPVSRLPARHRSQGWFLVGNLLPLWVLAVGATFYWAWTDLQFSLLGRPIGQRLAFALFGGTLGLGGFLVSRLWVSPRRMWSKLHGPAPLRLLAALREPATLTAVGVCGGLLTWRVASYLFPFPDLRNMPDTEIYVCFGAPLLLLMFLVAATIFVGLASNYTADADREWWARAGSWILILILVRASLSSLVAFGPLALERLSILGRAGAASLGGLSGIVTLFLGRSAKTAPAKKSGEGKGAKAMASGIALALAAPVFAVFLLILLSMGTGLLLRALGTAFFGMKDWRSPGEPSYDTLHLLSVMHNAPVRLVLLVAAGFLALGLAMGRFVNINRFSLHAAYRDRLIRAYLGASRASAERRPDPFTRFDEGDNLPMTELAANRPLPLLNLTLNLVSGKNPAWQDRKAEPFSVTPLHAGSYCLGYRDAARYGRNAESGAGITLGTAMAISGAAASPNMGYHSSSAVTFLMALWNVRLGWWLGNPGTAGAHTFERPGPRFAPRPLFAEAFGLTDDANPYVYLSDGGHFENLGLYEMVLRRCQVILVSDAGQDEEFSFADLGSAIAKIRIDLGVPIRFDGIPPMRKCKAKDYAAAGAAPGQAVPFWAVASIGYSEVDRREDGTPAEDGVLLYVKTSLNGTEPVDVFNYARAHPAFPHESTADQLYTEAQFESYRALGFHAATTACGGESLAGLLQTAFAGPERHAAEAPGKVANDAA